jgi:hypothetical protein
MPCEASSGVIRARAIMLGGHGRISVAADRGQDGSIAGAFTDWDGREWGGETEHHLVLQPQLRHSRQSMAAEDRAGRRPGKAAVRWSSWSSSLPWTIRSSSSSPGSGGPGRAMRSSRRYREQRVDVGTVGDPLQRAAGADREPHLPAPGGGCAVGSQQMPDGCAVAACSRRQDANCSPRSPSLTRRTRAASSTADATSAVLSGSIRTAPCGGPPARFGARRRAIVSIARAITPFSHTAQCMDEIGGQRHGYQPEG